MYLILIWTPGRVAVAKAMGLLINNKQNVTKIDMGPKQAPGTCDQYINVEVKP